MVIECNDSLVHINDFKIQFNCGVNLTRKFLSIILMTHDFYFMILADVVMSHVLAENASHESY